METKLKAKDILDYVLGYLDQDKKITEEEYKQLLKEIVFLIEND